MRYLVGVARDHGLAMRIGVNAGSIAPEYKERFPGDDHVTAPSSPARPRTTAPWWTSSGFPDYVVSIKDSDPRLVIEANQRFAEERPTSRSTWA